MTVLPVAPRGMLDTSARHPVDRAVPACFDSPLPSCTSTVNIVGSVRLGYPIGAGAGDRLLATARSGFQGVPITFARFGYDMLRPAAEDVGPGGEGTAVIDVAARWIVVGATGRWP
ncbi:fluoride efflux transporter CrcB [Nocardia sp. NPDC049190]|uniref:fluoride efflux transporter CrcB n=1 Tax=Nocardia sp. NPDC049190 TaxID=3155650 RepID=UPI003405239D